MAKTPAAKTAGAAKSSASARTKQKTKQPARVLPAVTAAAQKALATVEPPKVAALRELGTSMMAKFETSRAAFGLPRGVQDQAAKIRELVGARTSDEAFLSCLLASLQDDATVLVTLRPAGGGAYENFNDLADRGLNISPSRARALAANWKMFVAVGLSAKALGPNGVDFAKFKELRPLYEAGLLKTAAQLRTWLPLIAVSGPAVLTTTALVARIRTEMANARTAGTTDESAAKAARFGFMLTSDQVGPMRELLDHYKAATGIEGDGMCVFQAVQEAMAARVMDAPGVGTTVNLTGLMNSVARIAPVIPICIPTVPAAAMADVTTPMVRQAYGTFEQGQLRMCLSASIEAAASHFGVAVADVKAFPLTVAEDLLPEATHPVEATRQALVQADVPEEVQKTIVPDTFTFDLSDVRRPVRYVDGKGKEHFGVVAEVHVESSTLSVKPAADATGAAAPGRARVIAFADVREYFDPLPEPTPTTEAPKKRRAKKTEATAEAAPVAAEAAAEPAAAAPTTDGLDDLGDLTETPAAPATNRPTFEVTDIAGMATEVKRVAGLLKPVMPNIGHDVAARNTEFRAACNDGQPQPIGRALVRLVDWVYEQAAALKITVPAAG